MIMFHQLEKRIANLELNFDKFAGFKLSFLKSQCKEQLTKFILVLLIMLTKILKTDTFKDYFQKDALRHYFGSSSQHSSYFERYLYPIKE